MNLFGTKKEVTVKADCACNKELATYEANIGCCGEQQKETCCGEVNKIVNIKVLGSGCKSCHEQYENAKRAIEELGLDIKVEYITDMDKVMTYGVMSMPAFVVNEEVVSMGRVLKSTDIIKLLGKLKF